MEGGEDNTLHIFVCETFVVTAGQAEFGLYSGNLFFYPVETLHFWTTTNDLSGLPRPPTLSLPCRTKSYACTARSF